jgi:hypothetical protein
MITSRLSDLAESSLALCFAGVGAVLAITLDNYTP